MIRSPRFAGITSVPYNSQRTRRQHRWRLVALAVTTALAVAGTLLATREGSPRPAAARRAATVPLPPCQRPHVLVNVPGHAPGGPVRLLPAGGIPAIDAPRFESPAAAKTWLGSRAPVLVFRVGSDVRAYPLAILLWHEVVNDTVGGEPVAITYCPLCNTATVYGRRLGRQMLALEASGKLLLGAAILQDRTSGTSWLQPTGEWAGGNGAVVDLRQLASDQQSLGEASASYPGLRVLSRQTGFTKPYGTSPYGSTGRLGSAPSLYDGDIDQRLPPKTRVLGARIGAQAISWTYPGLRAAQIDEQLVGSLPVLAVFRPAVSSIGENSDLRRAPDAGSAGLFAAEAAGRRLDFRWQRSAAHPEGVLRDAQTGSDWSSDGQAIAGPLRGTRLTVLPHLDTYWYVWAAFYPDTRVWPGLPSGVCTR